MKEKKIEDYLPLYLGCQLFEMGGGIGEFLGLAKFGDRGFQIFNNCSSNEPYWGGIALYKPILRSLSDMSEEESEKWRQISLLIPDPIECDAERTRYLLSKYFDLFNLIESGLAIDKNSLK